MRNLGRILLVIVMKNVLITGARSGIIADVIKRIKNNFNLYVTVHTDSELKAAERVYKNDKNVRCMKLDITNTEDLRKLYEINVDILICNGAVAESGSLLDIPFDKVRDNFEVNFFSNLKLIRDVINKSDRVRIIVISSLAGKVPMPFLGSYSSSKAALSQMMRALRFESKLLDKRVDICLIEPGLYRTGFNKLAFDKKYDYMDYESFFQDKIEIIRRAENVFLFLFEKRSLNSISKKIIKAILSENPRFYYRAPLEQSLFVKIYNFFF